MSGKLEVGVEAGGDEVLTNQLICSLASSLQHLIVSGNSNIQMCRCCHCTTRTALL